jgi:hypothetical protein
MDRSILLPALAVLVLAVGGLPAAAKIDPATVLADDESDSQSMPESMPDKIREKLSADGYQDITVVQTSYVVSATDKEGKRVLLLIGPASSTSPEQAQSPPGKDQSIQQ